MPKKETAPPEEFSTATLAELAGQTEAPPAPAVTPKTSLSAMPSIGRIVHYVLDSGPNKGQVRPAIVVRTWGGHTVNLQVFCDSANDDHPPVLARTSVSVKDSVQEDGGHAGEEYENTWRWPPRF